MRELPRLLGPLASLVLLGAPALPAARALARMADADAAPVTSPAPGSRHIALLIGIASYRNLPVTGAPDGLQKLQAPVAYDLPRMAHALEKWGFRAGPDMRVLRDSQATRRAIADGFAWLAREVHDTSDVVVVYFSGHGSYAKDADHDEARLDPDDEYDEALVPWDVTRAGIHDASELVLDDDIGRWLRAIGTRNITLIVDACFSGTITRGASGVRLRGPAPPPGGLGRSRAATRDSAAMHLDEQLADPRYAIITAAAPGERASERDFDTAAGKLPFGVLTYYLTQALDAAGEGTRYADLIAYIRQRVGLLADEVEQLPQLEGAADALLFDVRARTPAVPVVVLQAAGGTRYRLDAGAVQGVARDATYDVYPPGTTAFTNASRLGRLEVDSVGRTTASGQLVEGNPGAVPNGALGLLAVVPPGARRVETVSVRLGDGGAAARRALASLPFVRLTTAADADATVSGSGDVFRVFVGGTEVRPSSLDEARVVGADTGFAASAEALCPALSRAFVITALHAVHNDNAPYLDAQLRVDPLSYRPGPLDEGRQADTIYYDGRDSTRSPRYRIWLRVKGESASRLHASVAFAGFTAAPWVAYSGGLVPGDWVQIYPALDDPDGGLVTGWPTGMDEIRVIVRDKPYDFRGLLATAPACAGDRALVRSDSGPPTTFRGWTAFSHPIVTLERHS